MKLCSYEVFGRFYKMRVKVLLSQVILNSAFCNFTHISLCFCFAFFCLCSFIVTFRCRWHERRGGLLQYQRPRRGFLLWGVEQQPAQRHQAWRQRGAQGWQPEQQHEQHQESHYCTTDSGQGARAGEGAGERAGDRQTGGVVYGSSGRHEEASTEAAVASSEHQLGRHPAEPHKEAPELPRGPHASEDWQHLLQQVLWLHEFQPERRRWRGTRGGRRLWEGRASSWGFSPALHHQFAGGTPAQAGGGSGPAVSWSTSYQAVTLPQLQHADHITGLTSSAGNGAHTHTHEYLHNTHRFMQFLSATLYSSTMTSFYLCVCLCVCKKLKHTWDLQSCVSTPLNIH